MKRLSEQEAVEQRAVELRVARRDFAAQLVLMKDRAARLGLWKSMHALDGATQAVGWEIAELGQKEADHGTPE